LLPGFGEDSPVPEMLTELFRYAAENMVCAVDLFPDERLEVKERLRKERRTSNIKTPTAMAAQLLRDEYDKDEKRITDADLKRSLKGDQHGTHFANAPAHISRLYVRGITCYGTRRRVTPAIAIWLATIGRSEAKAVEVLTYWVNNRPHVSRNIKDHVDEVIEDLPMLVSKAYKYARQKQFAAGDITLFEIRLLVDMLTELPPDVPVPPRAPPRSQHQRVWDSLTNQYRDRFVPAIPETLAPRKPGTSSMHFLKLGFELVRFLRGKGGECHVAHSVLEGWGKRDYLTHFQKLLKHGVISQTSAPNMNTDKAATLKLLWKERLGDPVTDLLDGLAAVMSEQEVQDIFKDCKKLAKDILTRMKRQRRT
jgi:hypothetical protein